MRYWRRSSCTRRVVPPGLDRAGKPFEHPQPGLGFGLARLAKGELARLIHGHALRGELVPAEHAVHEFARLAILLEAALMSGPADRA